MRVHKEGLEDTQPFKFNQEVGADSEARLLLYAFENKLAFQRIRDVPKYEDHGYFFSFWFTGDGGRRYYANIEGFDDASMASGLIEGTFQNNQFVKNFSGENVPAD